MRGWTGEGEGGGGEYGERVGDRDKGGRYGGGGREILGAGFIPKFVVFY